MADTEVLAWAQTYAERNTIGKLAELVGYKRPSLSLYLSGKYPADPGEIEKAIRPHMSSRVCPYLERSILSDDCQSRRHRPRPQQAGSAMEDHWNACQRCVYHGEHHE